MLDLAVDDWDPDLALWAERVAISVPMHTAARLAHELAPRIDRPIGCFGLYAGMCADLGVALVGRDPVTEVVRWVEDDHRVTIVAPPPARDLLPPPDRYAHLIRDGLRYPVAATDASDRLCPPLPALPRARCLRRSDSHHRRRHGGRRRRRRRSAAGARHVTYGDPDFFNGVHHARRVVDAVQRRVPRRDVRLHREGRARAPPRRPLARAGPARLPVRGQRVRVRERPDTRDPRQGAHRARRDPRRRHPARRGDRAPTDLAAVHPVVDRRRRPRHPRVRRAPRSRRQRRPGAVLDPSAGPRGLVAPRSPPRPRALGPGAAEPPLGLAARPAPGRVRRAGRGEGRRAGRATCSTPSAPSSISPRSRSVTWWRRPG